MKCLVHCTCASYLTSEYFLCFQVWIYFYCCLLLLTAIVYKSESKKQTKVGSLSKPLKPPLVMSLLYFITMCHTYAYICVSFSMDIINYFMCIKESIIPVGQWRAYRKEVPQWYYFKVCILSSYALTEIYLRQLASANW